MIANGTYTFACNTWAISNFINPWIKYLLIISCKQVSPLIVLAIYTPKPTRGLDALSISLFFVIDDKPIKAYKRIFYNAFEFSDLVWAPPQFVQMNELQWIWPQMPICTNQRIMGLPINLSIHGVQKVYVCLHKNSTHDACDKINHLSSKKRPWLCLVPTGQTSRTDRSDRSAPDSQPKNNTTLNLYHSSTMSLW